MSTAKTTSYLAFPVNQVLVEDFLLHEKRDGKADSSLKRERTIFDLTIGRLDKPVEDLIEEEWHAMLDVYDDKPRTHNGALVYLNKLRLFLGLERLQRKAKKIKPQEKIDLDFTDAEFDKLLAVVDNDRDRVAIDLMRYGGLRAGEVILLEQACFADKGDHVMVHFWRPKTNKWGDVALVECVVDIKRYLQSLPKDGPVFPAHGGKSKNGKVNYSGLYNIVQKWCEKAGVQFHPHFFRAYRATELGNAGFTKWDLDNKFGWESSGNTASIYVRLQNAETIKKERAFGGNTIEEKGHEVKKCKRCQHALNKMEKFCPVCGLNVNPVEALPDNEMSAAEKTLETILTSPEMLQTLLDALKNKK